MVKVIVKKEDNYYRSITMEGHADFNPGNDIVCSAISVLGYTLAGALLNAFDVQTEDNCFFKIKKMESGLVDIQIEKMYYRPFKDKLDTIFETILIGLLQIEKKYPENVSVEVKE